MLYLNHAAAVAAKKHRRRRRSVAPEPRSRSSIRVHDRVGTRSKNTLRINSSTIWTYYGSSTVRMMMQQKKIPIISSKAAVALLAQKQKKMKFSSLIDTVPMRQTAVYFSKTNINLHVKLLVPPQRRRFPYRKPETKRSARPP